jgi:hypothetical protein
MRKAVLLVVVLAACAGCVQKSKHQSQAEREAAAQIVSKTAPKPSHPLDIRFGERVRLLGYDVNATEIREGQPITVTWYWQVEQPLGDGWKVFTHLVDADNKSRMNLDAVRAVREMYPEAQWKPGDFIRDTQEVTVPPGWRSSTATFCLGFWNGPDRLQITTGPHDNENRAPALTLSVIGAGDLPRLLARHITAPITIDGKLDEDDWKQAQPSSPFVQTMTGSKGAFAANVRVLYDANRLYLGYQVEDSYLKCTFQKNDDHLWEQDAIELMVDPDGDGKNYFEVQVSPTGLVFDTRYDTRRSPRPFGEMAWSSAAEAKVALRGKPNDDAADQGYDVELAIPWSAFAAGSTPASPPAAGAVWRMNFFVMDALPNGQRAVGWSPPMIGDFHTLDRFGRVVFPQAALLDAAPPQATPVPVMPRVAPK